jgi:hypothetical protein
MKGMLRLLLAAALVFSLTGLVQAASGTMPEKSGKMAEEKKEEGKSKEKAKAKAKAKAEEKKAEAKGGTK